VSDQVKQQQINNAVWAACDTFRGVVDAAGYKDYILVMLFLKYVSDVWKSHVDAFEKEFEGVPEAERRVRIERRMSRERFILPMVEVKTVDPVTKEERVTDTFRASFYSLFERRTQPNIGELINIALEALEDANRAKLEGVFRKIDFNNESNLGEAKDRNRRLRNLLEDFAKPELDLSPHRVSEDVIGEAYIYLISKFASDAGKKAGEFYTPAVVSKLLARLAGPKPGDKICDPACGSGSLLIRAAEEVGGENYALFGQEVNGQTWALARMNMFLHAKDAARIEWCDTLNSPKLVENNKLQKFDVVVANPPFSLDKWGAEDAAKDPFDRYWRADRTIPPKSKADYAFITHMIEIAERRKGRVAVIVPHGVLFRGGAEGKIRRALIEENLLDAVVGLPANLFTTTGIPVAILVFDRTREQSGPNAARRDVLFIDASRDFTPGKKVNVLEERHMDRIMEVYRARADVERYAHVASSEEIAANDFNLNIPRYVDTFEAEEEIDLAALEKEIEGIEAELVEVRARMAEHLRTLEIR
jgi:type I restriction enzyme M protein